MKRVLDFAVWMILCFSCATGYGQQRGECATPIPKRPLMEVPQDYLRTQAAGGKMIKLFIHITKPESSISTPAQDEKDIMEHLEFMRQYFAPWGVCFIIQGFDQIVSNDITFIDAKAEDEENKLLPYLRPNCLNIFIHKSLNNTIPGNIIGTSWAIPNTFLSLEGAWTWGGNPLLAAHEVGHCLGLFHTFETHYGKELVARNGACSNCNIAGDKLCDTQADLNNENSGININCVYTGSAKDSCNNTYMMEPSNLMSYHDAASCLDYFHFSPQQSGRFHYFLDNEPTLTALLLNNANFTETTNRNYTSGAVENVARDNITINASSYIAKDAVRLQMSSGEIVIKPGAQFTPNNTGIIVLRANALCQ